MCLTDTLNATITPVQTYRFRRSTSQQGSPRSWGTRGTSWEMAYWNKRDIRSELEIVAMRLQQWPLREWFHVGQMDSKPSKLAKKQLSWLSLYLCVPTCTSAVPPRDHRACSWNATGRGSWDQGWGDTSSFPAEMVFKSRNNCSNCLQFPKKGEDTHNDSNKKLFRTPLGLNSEPCEPVWNVITQNLYPLSSTWSHFSGDLIPICETH